MKPARLAVCQTKSDSSHAALEDRARLRVARNMCGWTITARIVVRHGDLLDARMVDADGEHQTAEQRRRDVVDMHASRLRPPRPASRTSAARAARAGAAQQCVGGHHRGHRRGRRAAQPRAERDALVDLDLEAEVRASAAPASASSARPAVLSAASRGSSPATPRTAWIAHARRAAAHHRHPVAERLDREAEDVEADRDVADRGRRERRGAYARPARAHRRAPR